MVDLSTLDFYALSDAISEHCLISGGYDYGPFDENILTTYVGEDFQPILRIMCDLGLVEKSTYRSSNTIYFHGKPHKFSGKEEFTYYLIPYRPLPVNSAYDPDRRIWCIPAVSKE